MNKIKTLLRKNFSLLTLAGVVTGAFGGYLYYYYVGCVSGTCAITSNPYMSILWGAALGYLIFDMFKKKPKGEVSPSQEEDGEAGS